MQINNAISIAELLDPDVFYIYSHGENYSGFTFISPCIERFAGHSAQAVLEKPELFFGAIPGGYREFVWNLLTHPESESILVQKVAIPWQAGSCEAWTEHNGKRVTNKEGHSIITSGVIRDVTQLLKSTNLASKLVNARRYTSEILDSMSDGVLLVDLEGNIISSNSTACTMLDIPPKATLMDVLKESDFPAKVLKNEGWATDVFKRDPKIFLLNSHPILDTDSHLTTILVNIRDITENEARKQELQILHEAVQHASEGIILSDSQNRVIYANPAAELMTGYHADELKRAQIAEILGNTPSSPIREIERAQADGSPWSGRVDFVKNDNQQVFTELSTTPFTLNPEGERLCAYIARDITKQAMLEKSLNQAQKLEALGVLSGGIAHDFNNILAGIVGFAQLAKDKKDSPRLGQMLDEILSAGMRGKSLVSQILAFSRQRIGQKQAVEVGLIAKEVLKLIGASAPSTIEIRQEIKRDAGCVLADPAQIHQVIINLCTNAVSAMDEQGGVLALSVQPTTANGSDYIKITVSDTGPGIPPGTLTKIFDPFFTTKPNGTGLGLATVQGIVEECGGLIDISSQPGKGATFKILLPRTPANEETAKDETLGIKERPSKDFGVLFVDDEVKLTEAYGGSLTGLGYRVFATTSCKKALSELRSNPDRYDVLITDLTMPEMTGDKLIHAAREIKQLPAIITTGFATDTKKLQGFRQIEVQILQKPLLIRELAAALAQTLKDSEPGRIGHDHE